MDQPFPPPLSLTEPIEPEEKEILTPEQATRLAALTMIRPLLTKTSGFGGGTPPEVSDLIRLADWVLTGEDEDPYPYLHTDGTVQLGPQVTMRPDGFVEIKGDLFESTSDDGHEEDGDG